MSKPHCMTGFEPGPAHTGGISSRKNLIRHENFTWTNQSMRMSRQWRTQGYSTQSSANLEGLLDWIVAFPPTRVLATMPKKRKCFHSRGIEIVRVLQCQTPHSGSAPDERNNKSIHMSVGGPVCSEQAGIKLDWSAVFFFPLRGKRMWVSCFIYSEPHCQREQWILGGGHSGWR